MEDKANKQETESRGKESHHHHHHSHHSKRKKSSKFSRFIKKHKSVVINVAVIVAALAAVLVLGCLGDWNRNDVVPTLPKTPEAITDIPNGTSIKVEVPFYIKEVDLTANPVQLYMRSDLPVSAPDFFETFRPNNERLDIGLPVTLNFDVTGLPVEYTVASSTIEVSEDVALQNPRVFTLKGNERSVRVYHLKASTQYYYRINITLSNNTVTSVQGSFQTAQMPRVLSIEGAVNVRDIGGWKNADGKTIRQGLLYRGSEIDGAVEKAFCVTEKGRNDMLTVLGIRTDMDLRSSADNTLGTHALGTNVVHVYYDAPMYGGVFSAPEKVREIFHDLADAKNYPVYLHCTYGMDRTGTFCYLLEALLGVREEDLMRDYQLTALQFSVLNDEYMHAFIGQLRLMEGNTMQEKVTNYLLSVGVTEEEIANIKYIFIQE